MTGSPLRRLQELAAGPCERVSVGFASDEGGESAGCLSFLREWGGVNRGLRMDDLCLGFFGGLWTRQGKGWVKDRPKADRAAAEGP
jgi:hypothetical protein